MKRPWLLTQQGQRTSMLLTMAITVLLVPLAYHQITQEINKSPDPLDPADVYYCEVSSCGNVEKLDNLEVAGIESITEGEFGTSVQIRLINHGQLSGDREIWAELKTPSGERIESMRQVIQLSPKGIQILDLFFTGSKAEFESGVLLLGF